MILSNVKNYLKPSEDVNFFKKWKLFRIVSPVGDNVIENIRYTSVIHVDQDLWIH